MQFSPLTDYQRAILYSPCRYTITEASTKVGKTYSHIVWMLEKCVNEGQKGRNYWWIAPIFAQSEIAFERLERYLTPLIALRKIRVNKSKLYFQFWNGCRLWFKSAEKPDSLYGEDVYAAVFDEFTRAKEQAWHALRSTITKTRAPVKFIGNKTDPEHWGTRLAEKAENGSMGDDWTYFKITAWDAVDAGVLAREEVESARRELPDDIFKALYEVEWIEINGNPFFRHINLDRQVRPVRYDPKLPVYVSFDFNKRNTCVVAQRTDTERRYIEEYYMRGGEEGEDLEGLIEQLCQKYRNNYIYCTGDASGNGQSALTTGNRSAWQLIEKYFEKHGALWVSYDFVPRANLEHVNSRLVCNALHKYFGMGIVIDPGCVHLISDLKRMKTTLKGGLDKDDCTKHDYGHVGDCYRYDLCNFDYEVFESLGYASQAA